MDNKQYIILFFSFLVAFSSLKASDYVASIKKLYPDGTNYSLVAVMPFFGVILSAIMFKELFNDKVNKNISKGKFVAPCFVGAVSIATLIFLGYSYQCRMNKYTDIIKRIQISE